MSIKRSKLLIAMITVVLALLAWIVPNAETARAANTDIQPLSSSIQVSGLGAQDAVVTNSSGNTVQSNDTMYTWEKFSVSYKWSIADGVPVKAGDTAEFTLPDGLSSSGDLNNIPMYNDKGIQIGSFTIKAGQQTGTITFNDAFASTSIDREGTLNISSQGTQTNTETPDHFDWTINKLGWLYDYNEDGLPKYVVWNIAFNPNNENLSNVVITDTLGPGQTYVDSSVNAPAGHYNENGNFIPNGTYLTPSVTVSGNKVMFDFGNVNTAVDMTFRVEISPNAEAGNNWTDNANLSSDQMQGNVGADVNWGGSGTGSGTVLGNVAFQKTDANTGKPLPGAVYELSDFKGNVLMSAVTTDENGQINIHKLPAGNYVLKEVKAPDGYEINPNPISFTITGDSDIPIDLSQSDETTSGSITLTKIAKDTSKPLAGAKYDLYDAAGNIVKSNVTTDQNGVINVENLPLGKYYLVELVAPDGYLIDHTPIEINLTNENSNYNSEAIDYPILDSDNKFGNFRFTKIDENTAVPVPNAVYELRDPNGEVICNLKTDQYGSFSMNGLAPGQYYTLVEIIAPDGYELDQTPIDFPIYPGMTTPVMGEDKKDPVTNPGEPSEPETPDVTPPVEPGEPSEPETPGVTPPVEPGEPSEPETPGVTPPVEPGEPSEPEIPGITNPSEPETPGVTNPVKPGNNNNQNNDESSSVKPENPSPSVPISPGQPGTTTEPSLPETSVAGQKALESGRFPQTGNVKDTWIIIAGFAVVMLTLGCVIRKYDK